jgi:hypothetical protein
MDPPQFQRCERKFSLVFLPEQMRSEESTRQQAWAMPPLTGGDCAPR